MFFGSTSKIEYDQKPIKYPFSESDYIVAHNFFKRFRIKEEKSLTMLCSFRSMLSKDGDTPDNLAYKAYGDPFYDWIILLTNNLLNRSFDYLKTNYELTKYIEKKYDDPYGHSSLRNL